MSQPASIERECRVCNRVASCKHIGRGRYRWTCNDCLINGTSICIECNLNLPQSSFKYNNRRCIECSSRYCEQRIALQKTYTCNICQKEKDTDAFGKCHSPSGLIMVQKRCIECATTNSTTRYLVYMKHYMGVYNCSNKSEPCQRNLLVQKYEKSWTKFNTLASKLLNNPKSKLTLKMLNTFERKLAPASMVL